MLKYVLAASLVFNALLGINTGAMFACGTRHDPRECPEAKQS